MCVFSSVEHSTLTESESCETKNFINKIPEAKIEVISPLTSLTSEEPDPRNEELHQESLSTEDENKEGDELNEDDNEEFEEILIEPRTLNEVTSATDWTSPWTTGLSDPELGSLESLEATMQPVVFIHEKGRKATVTTSKPQRTTTDSDLSAGTESCENAGEDAEGDARDNVSVGHGDEVVFFKKDSTQDTREMTDHDKHDGKTDTEDDSPLSSSSRSSTNANSESEEDERKVQLYPFCLQYCL